MAKHEKEKKESKDDSTWDEEWEDNVEEEPKDPEEEKEDVPEVDITKLKFIKINSLKDGMENVNVKGEVDFLGETYGKGFGEAPYAIGFIKDKTGEIKMTFWGDDVKKSKPGTKIMVIGGMVNTYREQIQLNADRKRGLDFV